MDFSPFDAPVSVEPAVSPSLCAVPLYLPIVRTDSDTRHLSVIAAFARECQPSEMVLDPYGAYAVTFCGPDRYCMAISLWRYLASAGLARVAFRMESARPFRAALVVRDGAEIAAFIGKTYVFIG